MGREGWEGIIPFYNLYVLCEELYGNGWKWLLTLIPLYNIYFLIKLHIDWAKAFDKGAGFAVGMMLLPFIFGLILAFGDAEYGDGSCANTRPDFVSEVADRTRSAVSGFAGGKKEESVTEMLSKLAELRDRGVLSEEEFQEKKQELLNRI